MYIPDKPLGFLHKTQARRGDCLLAPSGLCKAGLLIILIGCACVACVCVCVCAYTTCAIVGLGEVSGGCCCWNASRFISASKKGLSTGYGPEISIDFHYYSSRQQKNTIKVTYT